MKCTKYTESLERIQGFPYNQNMIRKRLYIVKTIFGEFQCMFESNDPERGYTVTVPKLRGIVTCGDTIAEAKKMAKEAIELHCECLIDEGRAELKLKPSYTEREVRVFA